MTQIELITRDLCPNLSTASIARPQSATFSVVLKGGMSIDELTRLNSAGFSVIRSSHAGNLQASNIVAAQSGVTFLMHELLSVDEENYSPGSQIIGGKKTHLCSPSNKVALWQDCEGVEWRGEGFTSPIHVHLSATQSYWPNSTSLSEFILKLGKDQVERVLERFISTDREVAHAFIDENGEKIPLVNLKSETRAINIKFAEAKEMLLGHFQMISESIRCDRKPTKTIMPDTASLIVLSTIVDLLDPKKRYAQQDDEPAEVYHLAGVQMVNYLINNGRVSAIYLERITELYRIAREVIPTLPEHVIFNLVPTSHVGKFISVGGSEKMERVFLLARKSIASRAELNTEKQALLKEYQSKLVSTTSYQEFHEYMSVVTNNFPAVAQEVTKNSKKFSAEEFGKDPTKTKGRLVGLIALKLSSEKIVKVSEALQSISAEMRTLREEGAILPRRLSQYDVADTQLARELIPICVKNLSRSEFSELIGIISKA